jgi:pilus assembly protein CpaE
MATVLEAPHEDNPFAFDLPGASSARAISVAVVDPERDRRKQVAGALCGSVSGAIREVTDYLPGVEDARWLSEQGFDAVLVSADADLPSALRMVESLCVLGRMSVMVYSAREDRDLLVESMQAGAREVLTLPLDPQVVSRTLERVAARAQMSPAQRRKTAGRSFVFVGAKGGAGVTTVACNFALALAGEVKQSTLLIDLDLPMGDAALDLGVSGEYSTVSALEHTDRLDSTFLSQLLVRHDSGLSVLAAPGKFMRVRPASAAVDRLLAVARNDFDCVVIDAGSRTNWTGTQLYEDASAIYLVTQVGIPELRNANRMITECIPMHFPKVELVLNRYAQKTFGLDETVIERALTRTPQWKIPSDFQAVRQMQYSGSAEPLENSAIARIIQQMARTACGLPAKAEKKRGLRIFG